MLAGRRGVLGRPRFPGTPGTEDRSPRVPDGRRNLSESAFFAPRDALNLKLRHRDQPRWASSHPWRRPQHPHAAEGRMAAPESLQDCEGAFPPVTLP